MTSIVIPESVVTIEYGSFYYCKNLTSITIPSSVTSIGENAFYGCCQLDEIHIKCSTPPSIGSNVFYDVSTNIPVYVPCGSLLNYSGWGGFTDIRGESEKVKIGSLWYLLDCANHSATVVPELSVPQQITSPLYSNHSCPSGDITIPASVGYGNQTFAVTAIGDGAFAYCQNISSIVIPEGVTSIGNSAFAHCLDIASVVIPEGVTTIGNSAFYYCIELESVTIPNSMTGIGNEAFMNCDVMTSLTIGNSVTSIGNKAFSSCLSLESVTIPNSVISIGNNAFEHCYSLTSVTIGNSVTSIGNEAFISCGGLSSLTIGNSVTTIGNKSFFGCINLTSVTIPNSVTSVGNGTFSGCNGMSSLTIGNSVTSIGNEAFAGCNHLTEVHLLASNPPTLGTKVFLGLPHNTPIYVPCGTVSDYHSASDWSSFTNIQNEDDCFTVTVSPNDPEMGSTEGGNGYYLYWAEPTLTATPKCGYRFVHWINVDGDEVSTDAQFTIVVTRDTSLTAVFEAADRVLIDGLWYSLDQEHSTAKVVPEKNTSPYYETDHKPTGALVIPSSVSYCNNDYTVTAIDANAFYSCTGLTGTLVIPNTVISIGMNAFYKCTGLTGPLNLPESIVSLGISAFNYCSGFNSLSLPNSITRIENGTFSRCTGFSGTLVIPSSVTRIGADAFYGCTGFSGSLVIPNFVGHIDGGAFYYCNHITGLTIGSAVTNIDDAAFRSCTGLESIVVQCATPPTLGSIVFNQCPTDIPVTVPCNSVVAYQATNGWSSFSHIQEASTCPRTVTVTSADETMGTVTGDGTYTVGTTATLTATPNCGYRFVHWKNANNETVSNNASFNHTVTNDTSFTAVFEEMNKVQIGSLWYRLDRTNHTATVVTENDASPFYTSYPTGEVDIPASVTCGTDFSVTAIDNYAFMNCGDLTSLTIPNSVTSIGSYAFWGCTGLTSVTIPNSVTIIGEAAFEGCSSLTAVSIPNSVTRIKEYAFGSCSGLISVTIPNSMTKIEAGTFQSCTGLTSVTIPNSVTEISIIAFSNCSSLTSVTIPNSVTGIGNNAFSKCSSLTEIHSLAAEPPTLGGFVFNNVSTSIPVYVPCGTVAAYQAANGWSYFENIQEASTCTHTVTVAVNSPAMGTVSGDGTYTVGSTATLTATPNVGYHFVQWNDGNHDSPRSLTVTQDTTFTASFAPTTVYTTVDTSVCNNKFPFDWNGLTVTAAGSETATLQNHLGADSIVTINVHLNYTSAGDTTAVEFDHFTWYGHTYYQSTSTPTHLLTNAAGCDSIVTLHLTINPSHLGEFEITATADDATKGTVSGGGRFDAGQEVTLAASASCGYQFLQWSDGNTDNPRTVTVAGNATYTAQFQQANYIFETPSGQMLNYAVDCNTQTACVTGYTGPCRGLLVIPPLIRIEGVIYVVVSIGPSAFENNTGLLRVMIPGTVDAIYESAFRGCTNLAKVEGWYQLKGLE